MKKVLYLAVFALSFTTACYSSGINTPGIRASGLSPSLPSPAYGQLANQATAMSYKHVESMEAMNYELKMKTAWEMCINKHGPEICREIHGTGNWPYYMSNYYMPMYGSPMQQGMGYGMGSYGPYMSMQMQHTMNQTMAAHQVAAYTNMYNSYANAYANYAQTAAQAWSTPANDPTYDQKMAALKAMRDEVVALIKEVRPAIQQAAEQAGK